jgi:hypothetical protein
MYDKKSKNPETISYLPGAIAWAGQKKCPTMGAWLMVGQWRWVVEAGEG